MRTHEVGTMQIQQFMTPSPVACLSGTLLTEVARLMIKHDCGAIPVVEGGESHPRLIGMITDRDIAVRAVAAGKPNETTTAGEIMSHPIVSVPETASLEECVQVMQLNRLRRAPIVDQGGGLVGIVAQADLATRGTNGVCDGFLKEISQGFGPGHG